jgi:hypothetical protein
MQFLAADAKLPKEANLPRPPSRQVGRYLESRRDFPVIEVIEALAPLAQPGLLRTQEDVATIVETRTTSTVTTTALMAPIPAQRK